ncbi:DUF4363 family protein [Romboutsia sp.]|uniref:DUF4363 family protein n=1 Tax=Romboutsia sp. TaxID=1965302 RepID=UPI002B96AB0D|nr:DUF4363 family protein [Romboutsia sp.]HSQ89760.1 DUF4363 family protein [Romboutsia sp.]
MKTLIYSLIWTILFIIFGLYINSEIHEFTDEYTSQVDIIETYIKEDDWQTAKYELDKYNEDFLNDKGAWYKLLNHDYFDNICLCLDILDGSVYSKDKSMSLEQIANIKSTLDNILESVKCDLDHIF